MTTRSTPSLCRSVVEACVLGEDCHLGAPMIDSLLESTAALACGFLGSFEEDCKSYLDPDSIDLSSLDARTIFEIGSKDEYVDDVDLRRDGLDDLPSNYDALAQAIVGTLRMDPAQVYLTEIPDVTRDDIEVGEHLTSARSCATLFDGRCDLTR